MALGPEEVEKLGKLAQIFGGGSQEMSFQLDLKSVFVVLATAAMCVGKDCRDINAPEIVRTAFTLENLLFKPDGTLNE
jgi:hypothetical protein